MPLSNLHARAMTAKDLDRVIDIERAAYGFPWSEAIFRDCLRVGYECRVMVLDDEIVGYGILSALVREAHILNLCLDGAHRRLGLGRRLLEHLLSLALGKGVHEVFLEVRPSNVPALTLYRDFGFEQVGRRPNYYRAGAGREDALVLRIEIAQPPKFLTTPTLL
ncbi:MAG: ribosomal protein S18-alanine N-acetyltransferase [Gammaproteobacteria bacterium]